MTDQTDPAALVKAALERAAVLANKIGGDRVSELSRHCYETGYAAGLLDEAEGLTEDIAKATRALADDPDVVAEIIEQAKGHSDE